MKRLWLSALCAMAASGQTGLVYFGTYTGNTATGKTATGKTATGKTAQAKTSRGIYVSAFDARTGALSAPELAVETENPSFLAIDRAARNLYAVNETGGAEGSVSAFRIDRASGRLTFLNKVSSRGGGPCHLSLDRSGKYALAANYGGGSVAVFRILGDGRLGEAAAFVQHRGKSVDVQRQRGPHAHAIGVAPDNRFALAADLGLDRVLIYRFDALKGSLTPANPAYAAVKPGSGPRHFAFDPAGKFVYVVEEMASSVAAFAYGQARGTLRQFESVSTLPPEFAGENSAAEIAIHPSGRFLYASNRGRDSIAVFAIRAGRGTLEPVQDAPTGGKTPRGFAIDPSGAYLLVANQHSDTAAVFRIDANSGQLSAGQTVEVPAPVCVTFAPAIAR